MFFKECLEIADRGKDSENESQARIQRDRLRVDTRKWMAARLSPKKYGDRVSHDVQGNTTFNVQPAILINVGPADVSPALYWTATELVYGEAAGGGKSRTCQAPSQSCGDRACQ